MKKYLIIFLFMQLSACNNSSNIVPKDEISILYGVSFGMCVGPCNREMFLKENTLAYKIITTTGRGGNGEKTEKIYSDSVSNSEWKTLIQSFDFEKFKKLDEQIGCPDCADGGAEYVEISKNGVSHRIKIELGADIVEIKDILKQLRSKFGQYEQKYLNN